MNNGPGSIDKIVVNGKIKWENVQFKQYCTIIVGKNIEIDGKMFFKAKKNDTFYCNTIKSESSVNNFF